MQGFVDPCLAAEHRSAQHAALPVDMFGAGINHHIGAQRQRALQQWGGKDVVHHKIAPAACVHLATALISIISSIGLDGLSSSTKATGCASAACHCSSFVPSTNSVAIPKRGSSVETIQWQAPNKAREATTRSPAFKCANSAACTAAMPEAVTRHASAPSSKASRFSSMVTVGFPKREYW